MSAPGFVIVSDDDDSNVQTAVIDDTGNQIIVPLNEAANYQPLPVKHVPPGGFYTKHSDEWKKLVRNQYKCDLCEKLFKVSANLRDHRTAIHQVTDLYGEFPCDQCGIICLNSNQLNLHIYRSHGGGSTGQKIVLDRIKSAEEKRAEELEALVIKDENVKLSVVEELKVLETKADPKRPRYVSRQRHQCSLCSKNFSTPSMLQRHQSVHTGVKPFPCSYCSKSYTQSEHLQRHIRTAHVERVSTMLSARRKPLWHICKACGQRFTEKHRYVEHLKVHVNGLFQCHLCDRKFSIRNSLLRHIVSHQGQASYDCDVCSKKFVNHASFKKHKRLHSGCYPFACSVCAKGFAKKSRLLEHVEKHFSNPQTVLSCGVCAYVSLDSYSLQEHKKQHYQQKSKDGKHTTSSSQTPLAQDENGDFLPFKCNSCLLPFKEATELTRHCQIFHKFMITNTKGWSMFTCDPCCKSFDSQEVLQGHLKLHDSSGALLNAPKISHSQKPDSLVTYDFVQMGGNEGASKDLSSFSNPQNVGANINQFVHDGSMSTSAAGAMTSPVQDARAVLDIQNVEPISGHSSFQSISNRSGSLMSPDKVTSTQIQTEILYQIDSGKLYGISENGTLYQVVASENGLIPGEASTWPPTEQQMESGDLLLDIVAQDSCLPLSDKGDNSHSLQVIAEKTSSETPAIQHQSQHVQPHNFQTIN